MNIRLPLRDIQQDPVVAYCSKCEGEIYAEESIMPGCLCRECFERLKYIEEKEE